MKRISTFKNGHLDTIYPALFRKPMVPNFQRERIFTEDNDFLDLDWLRKDSKNLVLLSHGFEGSSHSQYILGMVNYLKQYDFDFLAWNFRSCSGEINLQPQFYHSGATHDLNAVIQHINRKHDYKNIFLVGFSMGGNLSLKYLGENAVNIEKNIKSLICFSTPLDLSDSCDQLSSGIGKLVYASKFLSTLKKKIKIKQKVLERLNIDVSSALLTTSLREFDDLVTGPLHGFKNAENYYKTQSSKNFLKDIPIKTLIINALNDPFLGKGSYPMNLDHINSKLIFETPSYGGHVGFFRHFNRGVYWSEEKTLEFLKS